jgi:Ca2+:H+ antiporter
MRPVGKRGSTTNRFATLRSALITWTAVVPVIAVMVLAIGWGRRLPSSVVAGVSLLLAGAVLAAVHHAEVVAHRVGEPLGSLVLAVAVTVIEVALIVTLMIAGAGGAETLARDTVFAAVILTSNGIVGLSILAGTSRAAVVSFNAEGSGAALATVATLATLGLVVPTFTTSRPGPVFSPAQLAFAAVTALTMYALFVALQTGRHREYFLPIETGDMAEDHATAPTAGAAVISIGLLLVSLVAVVGNAKLIAPTIEHIVEAAGLPVSVVGVVIAMLILLPETLAAVRAARRGRLQTSLNLAYGSAMASIGLTIPTLAIASIWLPVPLHLGLDATGIVLFALTCIVSVLTVIPGRATLLQAAVHLALVAAYLFLAVSP